MKDQVEISTFSVSSIEFDKTYRVMEKRIVMGYTARELSFLLGLHSLYVREIENPLNTKKYNADQTNYLLQIFDCALPEIMAGTIPELFFTIQIEHSFREHENKYDVYRIMHHKRTFIRHFTEESNDYSFPIRGVSSLSEIQEFIDYLFDSNFFNKPKTALEIFKQCASKFGLPLKPNFVLNAIRKYTSKRKAPRLISLTNDGRRKIYIKEV